MKKCAAVNLRAMSVDVESALKGCLDVDVGGSTAPVSMSPFDINISDSGRGRDDDEMTASGLCDCTHCTTPYC